MGDGLDATVRSVITADLGDGPTLLAGGAFEGNVAMYANDEWTVLGDGPGGVVYDLFIADLGAGECLVAAGAFGPSAAGAIAAWDGSVWTIIAGGLSQDGGAPEARALGIDPTTGALAVGGRFDKAGGTPAKNFALLGLCETAITADLDGSGVVDASDLAILLAAWEGPTADLDADGVVNSSDLAILLASWD